MTGSPVRWVSAFIDMPPDLLDTAATFWTAVSGTAVGSAVGDHGEFLPLEPTDGHPCLWLQRTQDGPVGCHPDLYVDDVVATAERAVALGAKGISASDWLVVLRSPGGLPFCLVRHRDQSVRPGPTGPARSIVDQICLDIPPSAYEKECDFWSELTGWRRTGEHAHSEFDRLARPAGIPYAFLLQRLDDEQPAVTVHLDLSADDREAETARHESLGADVVRRTSRWTVMCDPAGMVYCNTAKKAGDV